MGRGIGNFQRHLLRGLEARACSVNELRWFVWDQLGEKGSITKPFLSQTREALRRLEKRGRIRWMRRHLRDLDEVVQIFPSKTLDRDLRASRVLLLPHVAKLGAKRAKYSTAEVEAFLFADRRVAVAEASIKWAPLEQKLASEVATYSSRHWALPLISKGRELFLQDRRSGDESFQDLLASAQRFSNAHVLVEIRELLDEVFPADERNVSNLRSQLHGLIEMPRHGACRLRDGVRRELGQRFDLTKHRADQLLTREVLQEFLFIEPAARAATFARHRRSRSGGQPPARQP